MNILIAEDNASLVETLRELFTREGHIIDAVADGRSAVDYAVQFSYDVILLDVMLPELDGFEVIRQLRAQHVSTPTLMLTARASTNDKIEGLNAGADDYLTKPFNVYELLARVNALTRRRGDVILPTMTYGDLTLQLDAASLQCGEQEVQLSRKELGVLRLLMDQPKATITKDTMIVRVWGADSNATDNNVEAYISFLRKKLRFIGSNVGIRNLHGIGYRLEYKE